MEPGMREIAPRVYVKRDSRGTNLGAVVTSMGVVVVDTPMIPREARAWRAELEAVTGKTPIYIINTDHHKGHALGNVFFGAPAIAHMVAWKHMRGYGDNFKQRLADRYRDKDPETARELLQLDIQLPELTFEERMTLYLGDTVVDIIYAGGHTPASSIVYVPRARVVFAGDLVVCNMHPFMAQGSSGEWVRALEQLKSMPIDVLVPGHGEVCDKQVIDPLLDYLRVARELIRQEYLAGRSKSEAARNVLTKIIGFFPRKPSAGVKLEAKIKSGLGHVYDEIRREEEQKAASRATA
ncbi:MAG: MBL fold metallo-hydrolase [Anaerolineae bacterium]